MRKLTKKSIRFIRQFVAPQRNDMLSLYLDIRPEKSENKNRATFICAKDEVKMRVVFELATH